MGRVIAVVNQKGGVGKTTTVVNLSASLAAAERTTLAVDLDPQGNTTSGFGVGKDQRESIYQGLLSFIPLIEISLSTPLDNLKLVPSNRDLVGAEVELMTTPDKEKRLRLLLDPIRTHFDYILIDCPPSLGVLTLNALVAADAVLVPLQCEYFALEGLADLMEPRRRIQHQLNPALDLEAILLTMYY